MRAAKIRRGSNNIYKDLGFPNAREVRAKAVLASRILTIFEEKKWTQVEAAERLGLTQPKISLLSRGQFSGFSLEKLIHLLNKLNQDIEIVIKSRPVSSRQPDHVNVVYSAAR
jgi:predicted XRE-type DNA-binding protein